MGCLVKADIQGNKIGFWSDTISLQAEQLEAENWKKTVENHKKSFFSSGSKCTMLDSSQGSKLEYPRGFLFYEPILSQHAVGDIQRFRFFTKTPLRRLVAIFGTKWGGKLKFVSRSISCQKGNFLSPTISKWQPWEKCSKKAKKWPNLGFRAITLEPRDLGTSNLASWHPLGMVYLKQE